MPDVKILRSANKYCWAPPTILAHEVYKERYQTCALLLRQPTAMDIKSNLWSVSGKLQETPPESLRVSGESPESLPKALERLWRVSKDSPRVFG